MTKSILGWHFVGKTLRDGRPIPKDGEVLVQKGPIVPCKQGLHASEKLLDALRYAPGMMLCRVELSGAVQAHGGDKHAASRRVILWRLDATEILLKFARECAKDVLHLWDAPDIMKQFLETGENPKAAADATNDKVDHAATYAARAATYGAVCAARAAAVCASHAAARVAAAHAAYAAHAAAYAARAATYGAARAAARGAAIKANQNNLLTEMVLKAHETGGMTQ